MKNILNKLLKKQDLTTSEVSLVAEQLASGELPPAVSGAFLMGLAMKGESVEEITALVTVLRQHMTPIELSSQAIDTCGTGGDGASTINVSTLAAFVCAAAGARVVKHGNRAISSKCGSFDLLEALGIKIDPSADQVKVCFRGSGLAFLFAPNFHPAFAHIGPIRKSLGIKTIFNYLGPLLNPAGVARQVIGVSSGAIAEKLGSVLLALGSEHVLLVSSTDGLDEVSCAAPTNIFEYKKGEAPRQFIFTPEKIFSLAEVKGGEPIENAARARAILAGEGSPAEKVFVAVNAGFGLYVSGQTSSIEEGIKLAEEILTTDKPQKKLAEVIALTNES